MNRLRLIVLTLTVSISAGGMAERALAISNLQADSETAWSQNAVVTERNNLGAACYGKSWGKLQYKAANSANLSWLQQLLPDCKAVPYRNPFAISSVIRINGATVNYAGRLKNVSAAPYVTQRYKGNVPNMLGHSGDESKSRNKGSSEIDLRLRNTAACSKSMSKAQSLNLPAWNDEPTLRDAAVFGNGDDKCNSFQYPITVVRPGKIVACLDYSTVNQRNFGALGKFTGVVVESKNTSVPIGQMFAGKNPSTIYHYDVYVHLNDIVPSAGRVITIDGVQVPAKGRCKFLMNRVSALNGKGYVAYGEVIGLMGASGTTVTHLHLETVVCTKSYPNEYVTRRWTGDGSGKSGCRWNRPYWTGLGGGTADLQELPGKMGVNVSSDEWNYRNKYSILQPPYVEVP